MPKPLPKAPQTRQRPPRHRRRKLPRFVKPLGEPHHLLVAIHHLQPPAIVERTPAPRTKASNDQVEAVGAKVQRGVRFIERLRRLALLRMGVRGHGAILTSERARSPAFVKAGTHRAVSITPTLPPWLCTPIAEIVDGMRLWAAKWPLWHSQLVPTAKEALWTFDEVKQQRSDSKMT